MNEIKSDDFENQCNVINDVVNNSDCPCEVEQYDRLKAIRFSLAEYYCRDLDDNLMQMKTYQVTFQPNCRSVFRSATFIISLTVGVFLALVVVVL